MKKLRKSVVKVAPIKKKISWSIVTMFCFGIFFIAGALIDRSRGIEGHYSKGAFVTWQRSLAAGIVMVIGATCAVMTKTKTKEELNQTSRDNARDVP